MRTTLDIEEAVLKAAKRHAAASGDTLTHLIEQSLRQFLARPTPAGKPFRLQLVTKRGRLRPGIDLSDRDALYERLDGRA